MSTAAATVKPIIVRDVARVSRVLKLNERVRIARTANIDTIYLLAGVLEKTGLVLETAPDPVSGIVVLYAARRTRRAVEVTL